MILISIFNDMPEEFFLMDLKKKAEFDISNQSNPFYRLMKRYYLEKGDYERSAISELAFTELGWQNNKNDISKDIINSFWTTFTSALVFEAKANDWRAKNGDLFYTFDKINCLLYTVWNPDTKKYGSFNLTKEKYSEIVLDSEKIYKTHAEYILKKYPRFKSLASLSDSIANFMPCPPLCYNSIKGTHPEIKDYLNLMIDKIQSCIDQDRCLNTVSKKDLKNWHQQKQNVRI